MPYIADLVGFDPDDYPQTAVQDPRTRSLALQVPNVWVRRAYPPRWLFTCDGGTGDYRDLAGSWLLAWTGYLGDGSFLTTTTRSALPNNLTGRFEVAWIDVESVRFVLEIEDPFVADKFIYFEIAQDLTTDWQVVTFPEVDDQGANWAGSPAGPVKVKPVRQWEDISKKIGPKS